VGFTTPTVPRQFADAIFDPPCRAAWTRAILIGSILV
jgi:hypothetical protein